MDFKQIDRFPDYSVATGGSAWKLKSCRGTKALTIFGDEIWCKITPRTFDSRDGRGSRPMIQMSNGGVVARKCLSVLVAKAFVDPRVETIHQVGHIDGDLWNTASSNLEAYIDQKRCLGCRHLLGIEMFHLTPGRRAARDCYCKPCRRKVNNQWYKDNPERRISRHREKTYNLTCDEYRLIQEFQVGMCDICKRKDRKLSIDHDHDTGMIRGLLCQHCNYCIHVLDDKKKRSAAIDYIENPPAVSAGVRKSYNKKSYAANNEV